jgi:Replication protein A OB domain
VVRTLQQFNTTRHDFEITLETQTQIDVVPEDAETHAIPSIQYHVSNSDPCSLLPMLAQASAHALEVLQCELLAVQPFKWQVHVCNRDSNVVPSCLQFRRIEDIENLPAGTMVDVLGVVERCDPSYNLQLRNGTDAQKRSLILKDASNKTVEV